MLSIQYRFFKTVQWKVVSIYILLILIAMQVIGAYFIREVENYYVNNFTETLNTRSHLLAVNLQRYLDIDVESQQDINRETRTQDIHYLVTNLFALRDTEIQVIDRSGVVVTTSEEDKSVIGQKNKQREVNLALLGTPSESTKLYAETGQRVRVLAIPVKSGSRILGAIYMVASMEHIYKTMNRINNILFTATVISLLMTGTLGVFLARTITTPVKEITKQASAMAEGDFDCQVKVYSDDEIGQLAAVFNFLALRLREALTQNEEEKEKLASILLNMSDGVIATDKDDHIILLNKRAEEMIGTSEGEALGTKLYEVLELNPSLLANIVSNGTYGMHSMLLEPRRGEHNVGLILRATFRRLKSIDQHNHLSKGMIVVLQDVTEQEKLEKQRKEFVANVSHELRTPLTTLKSYLEALEDGAIHDSTIAPRFIHVTLNETERMIRLVTDLLQLSHLDSKKRLLRKQSVDMSALIGQVIDRFSVQFAQKGIRVNVNKMDVLPFVFVDSDSITQVLDNLLSNAVKYSYTDTSVEISVFSRGEELCIEIEDEGVGIPKEDISRIFDRFYRVDKARSREMGGTGLGLSIAREIVHAHQGEIFIESKVGKGTKVTFTVPIMKELNHVG